MPLSKPVPRKHIHSRDIVCRGYSREDGLWDIEGSITDTKTYSFDNHDRGGVAAGEPVHRMLIRLTLDEDMVVHAAEAVTEYAPHTLCPVVTSRFDELKGLRVAAGWRRAVLEMFGRVRGCTHLTDLLVGPMAVTAQQTIATQRARRLTPDPETGRPPNLESCHAYATDSPVVKRQWPQFYTGE